MPKKFEKEFANYFGSKHAVMVNSGSSANLLAISALCSAQLGEDRIKPGDEVITCATGFPTTINSTSCSSIILSNSRIT